MIGDNEDATANEEHSHRSVIESFLFLFRDPMPFENTHFVGIFVWNENAGAFKGFFHRKVREKTGIISHKSQPSKCDL